MLIIEGSFINASGFDAIAFDIIEHLKQSGFPYRLGNRACIESQFVRKIGTYRTANRFPNDYKLIINPVTSLDYYGVDDKTIVYTVWDTSLLPIQYVNLLNKAHRVLVMSQETKSVFEKSGVSVQIDVLPVGFSPLHFHRETNNTPKSGIVFGTSGNIISPTNDRKNIQFLIDTFIDVFRYNPYDLSVKLTPSSPLPNTYGMKNITVINSDYTDQQMGDWYRSLSCYVTTTHYESFGRQPMEAMACGIPVITPIHSGLKDYLTQDNCYPISSSIIPANSPPYTEGDWYSVNQTELKNTLNYVVTHPLEIQKIGLKGFQTVWNKFLDNSSVLDKLEKLLIPYTEW